MKLSTGPCALLTFAPAARATDRADATPAIFAPHDMAGDADDGAATVAPDDSTEYFMRGTHSFTLMTSHRVDGQ